MKNKNVKSKSSLEFSSAGSICCACSGANLPVSINAYGAEASLQLSDKFILGGWAGYTNTRILASNGSGINRGSLDIWNWAVTLAFPDLGKKGNLAVLWLAWNLM